MSLKKTNLNTMPSEQLTIERKARKTKNFYQKHLDEHTNYLAYKLAKAYGVPRTDLFGQRRSTTICALRRVLYHTLRNAGYSLQEIAATTNRHHATIIHYLKTPVPNNYKKTYTQLTKISSAWREKHLNN